MQFTGGDKDLVSAITILDEAKKKVKRYVPLCHFRLKGTI